MIPTRIAALAAILLALTVSQAEASKFNEITCFRGDTHAGCSGSTKPAKIKKYRTKVSKPMKIDKSQEYAVEPNGKLIKREVHEARSGLIRSAKTGASARVSPKYASKFQAYINDLEAAGASIKFLGGFRAGPCSIPRHKHPCGMAIDVCQYGRGIVDRRCNLPGKQTMIQIAKRHGLVEGAVWCHGDLGHAEVRTGRQAEGCGRNLYASVEKFKEQSYQP